jgi:hypothetical protein
MKILLGALALASSILSVIVATGINPERLVITLALGLAAVTLAILATVGYQ